MMCVALTRTIGGVVVDVMIEERHLSEMEVPQHPVERGAAISDHAWRKPRNITITGVVRSEVAIFAYQQLLDLQERSEPFDFMTPLKLYPSMLVERLEVTRDVDKARVLYFEADLKEVIIVSTESEASQGEGDAAGGDRNGARASADKAKATVNRGRVQPQPVDSGAILRGGLRVD